MDTTELKAKWNKIQGQVKVKWGELTDDDLKKIEGNKDQLIATLQERYKYAKDQATNEVNQWLESIKSSLEK